MNMARIEIDSVLRIQDGSIIGLLINANDQKQVGSLQERKGVPRAFRECRRSRCFYRL